MVIDGKGVDSIGTCQTAVITGFCSHPLKHWSIPITDKTNPKIMIRSHIILDKRLFEVPMNDTPCRVDVVANFLHNSWNDKSLSIK